MISIPRHGKIIINKELCKSCGLCVSACPFKLITISNELNKSGFHPAKFEDKAGKCLACGFCYRTCPDVAIEVWEL